MMFRTLAQLFNPGWASDSPDIRELDPDVAVVYAVGDVHGRYDLLQRMEDLIAQDHAEDPTKAVVIYTGDLIDRGPQSAHVLDHLTGPTPFALPRLVLRGNHEDMMTDFLREPSKNLDWLDFGGLETLASYGIVDPLSTFRKLPARQHRALLDASIPAAHQEFLDTLPHAIETRKFFFCHAGVDPGKPLAAQLSWDLLWSREPFMSHSGGFEKIIVHGHTPVATPGLNSGRLSLDTSAYKSGHLTAAKLDLATGSIELMVAAISCDEPMKPPR